MGRKNVQGGNKTKGMARKNGSYESNVIVRPVSNEEEYAIITAVSGNGRFRIKTESKKDHVAVLPGSMRGNKKRKNFVQLNSIVMINNRISWQSIKPMSTVDIVHVYSTNHIAELRLNEKFQEQLQGHYNRGSQIDDSLLVFQANNDSSIINDDHKYIKEEEEEEDDFDMDLI
jgi:translation initiation factor IF-1